MACGGKLSFHKALHAMTGHVLFHLTWLKITFSLYTHVNKHCHFGRGFRLGPFFCLVGLNIFWGVQQG